MTCGKSFCAVPPQLLKTSGLGPSLVPKKGSAGLSDSCRLRLSEIAGLELPRPSARMIRSTISGSPAYKSNRKHRRSLHLHIVLFCIAGLQLEPPSVTCCLCSINTSPLEHCDVGTCSLPIVIHSLHGPYWHPRANLGSWSCGSWLVQGGGSIVTSAKAVKTITASGSIDKFCQWKLRAALVAKKSQL